MYTKARFGSIPDNEKWIGKKSGEGGGRQVADVFFSGARIFLLPVTVMLNCKKVEELGLVKGAWKGIERAGFTVIWASPLFGHPSSQNPGDMGIPFSYYLSDLG